jgi:hypothetical protein
MTNRLLIVAFAVLALDLTVRAGDQIRSYTVPKEQAAAPVAQPLPQPGQAAPDIPVNSAPISWAVPAGWQQLPPDGVRIGNFAAPGKDGGTAAVAITSFPGEVGTELSNVNRWRQQVGLEPLEQGGVASDAVSVDSSDGRLYDLAGSTARTIVAQIPRNGATWFFKLTGDAGAVSDAKPSFMEFLKSVRFTAGSQAVAEAPVVAPAAVTPAVASAGDSDSPKWSVPSNWSEKAPGAMIFKSFSVGGDGGATAAVTVSFFQGAMGGALANINRWRGQMGLGPVAEDQLASVTGNLETAGGKGTLVDFEGADAKAGQRLVAVMLPHGENMWFYKLLGDKSVVAKEKDSFVNFVKTVQYP